MRSSRCLVVDGMNVIGSRPDGWWRDRDAAARRLAARLAGLAAAGEDVTLVLDGRPPAGLGEGRHGGVAVRFARRRGRDAADDRIVELVAATADPAAVEVVTSDRGLRARVVALGASVTGAGSLLARLDALDAGNARDGGDAGAATALPSDPAEGAPPDRARPRG